MHEPKKPFVDYTISTQSPSESGGTRNFRGHVYPVVFSYLVDLAGLACVESLVNQLNERFDGNAEFG